MFWNSRWASGGGAAAVRWILFYLAGALVWVPVFYFPLWLISVFKRPRDRLEYKIQITQYNNNIIWNKRGRSRVQVVFFFLHQVFPGFMPSVEFFFYPSLSLGQLIRRIWLSFVVPTACVYLYYIILRDLYYNRRRGKPSTVNDKTGQGPVAGIVCVRMRVPV